MTPRSELPVKPDVRIMLQVIECYRACCHTCGWFGALRPHRASADADAEIHRKEHKP